MYRLHWRRSSVHVMMPVSYLASQNVVLMPSRMNWRSRARYWSKLTEAGDRLNRN
jgi:hypothetical protein